MDFHIKTTFFIKVKFYVIDKGVTPGQPLTSFLTW